MDGFAVKIKTLTPIWTGDADRRNRTLRETGIIGSLRWWYEAVVRGLDGYACDPTNTKCNGKDHCDACELFGCTDWARKFRLEVEKSDSEVTLHFIELRKIKEIEWALLSKTLQIIADYGAIGGKIAESGYGLIEIVQNDLNKFSFDKIELDHYFKKQGSNVKDPNIERFVFIKDNLNDKTVKNAKNKLTFLKGHKGKAKRYFYKVLNNQPYRFFAYAENNDEYKRIVEFLRNNKSVKFMEGKEILEGLK